MVISKVKNAVISHLATKLILAVLLLLSSVAIVLTSFFIMRQKKLLSEELLNRTQSLAQNLAYNSRNQLFSEDNSTIQSLVYGVKEEPDIENVFLTDIGGKILAHSNTDYIGKTFTIPVDVDSINGRHWFSTDDMSMRRMIIPVGMDLPIVDNDSTLFFSLKGGIPLL